MTEHRDAVTCIKIFDDDAHALTGSKDRSIICWDLRHEKLVATLRQRMGGVNNIALYVDQVQVISVGQDRKLTFWDLRETDPVHAVTLGSEACAIALSFNGSLLATGGKDQLIRLWTFDGAQHVVDGMGHSGVINAITFSPDDRQMVSVGDDGCIFVWNIYA
jgi:WD40 repeat protein